jgi:hypothetical protein
MSKTKLIPVVITTDKDRRGVFFGYINPEDVDKNKLRIEQVQMCIAWNDTHGVLGLASTGPNPKCRITKPVPAGTIDGITAILEATKTAEREWHKCHWAE